MTGTVNRFRRILRACRACSDPKMFSDPVESALNILMVELGVRPAYATMGNKPFPPEVFDARAAEQHFLRLESDRPVSSFLLSKAAFASATPEYRASLAALGKPARWSAVRDNVHAAVVLGFHSNGLRFGDLRCGKSLKAINVRLTATPRPKHEAGTVSRYLVGYYTAALTPAILAQFDAIRAALAPVCVKVELSITQQPYC